MKKERTEALKRVSTVNGKSVATYVWLEKDDRGDVNLIVSDVSGSDIAPWYVLSLTGRGTVELYGDLESTAVGLVLDPYDDSPIVV